MISVESKGFSAERGESSSSFPFGLSSFKLPNKLSLALRSKGILEERETYVLEFVMHQRKK